MTLKEELEVLRGEPIEVFDGDPMDIPCIETSDPEKLCKHPVVSVHMITYNHEPYIRQAIEGVMMQKTDFEFELVIGEDASTDKTREICFEYQKRYPEKIRVLWWHENVSKLGGNGRRNRAHCRGEFIAMCEGDDYWIDSTKLQKQVDAMREYPGVGAVFTNAKELNQDSGRILDWGGASCYRSGLIKGIDFFSIYSFGASAPKGLGPECFIATASGLFRRKFLEALNEKYDLFSWKLLLGDKQIWLGCSLLGDLYYLSDKMVVYRQHRGGAMSKHGHKIYRDSAIVKIYFTVLGPYNFRVPFNIFAAACQAGVVEVSSTRKIGILSHWRLVATLLRLMRKWDVSVYSVPIVRRIKWLIWMTTGWRRIFGISRQSFKFFPNRPRRTRHVA